MLGGILTRSYVREEGSERLSSGRVVSKQRCALAGRVFHSMVWVIRPYTRCLSVLRLHTGCLDADGLDAGRPRKHGDYGMSVGYRPGARRLALVAGARGKFQTRRGVAVAVR